MGGAMMQDVMVDLETLGSVPGCSILSIGAVGFGPGRVGSDTFEVVVTRESCAAAGLHEDRETIAWWDRQSPAAREVLRQAASDQTSEPLLSALTQFSSWLGQFGANVRVWGNGADFDNAILAAAYRAVGMKPYWRFWNGRCYRTLKGLRPDIKLDRSGTSHRALDDALSQAEHASRLLLA